MSYQQNKLMTGLGFAQNDPAFNQAYTNLMRLLIKKGEVDPRGRTIRQDRVAQDVSARRDDIQAAFANAGFQNAGLVGAFDLAAQASGANQISQIGLEEQQAAMDRQRQNLALVNQLTVNPAINLRNIKQQEAYLKAMQDAQKKNGFMDALGAGVGLASLFV